MNKIERTILWFIAGLLAVGFVALVGIVSNPPQIKKAFGDQAVGQAYTTATNGTSTCGQLATGNFTIGANSSSVSTATSTSPFTIFIDGTTVTSTAVATATANSIANALVVAIPSSTLQISVGTTTDGTLIKINVTSTAWGAFVTTGPTHDQLGMSITATSTFPSSQIVGGASWRTYFSATYDTSSTKATRVYLCKGPSCAVQTGQMLISTSNPFVQNSTDQYNGPYSCIAETNATSTASSSLLNIIYSQP